MPRIPKKIDRHRILAMPKPLYQKLTKVLNSNEIGKPETKAELWEAAWDAHGAKIVTALMAVGIRSEPDLPVSKVMAPMTTKTVKDLADAKEKTGLDLQALLVAALRLYLAETPE